MKDRLDDLDESNYRPYVWRHPHNGKESMTTQELHDIQIAHFSKPDAKFGYDQYHEEGDGGCVYRGAGGVVCAVGCAIPDKLYSPEFEGMSADALIGKAPHQLDPKGYTNPGIVNVFDSGLAELFADVDVEYLRASQRLHDDMAGDANCYMGTALSPTVEDFVVSLKELARKHGLEVSA